MQEPNRGEGTMKDLDVKWCIIQATGNNVTFRCMHCNQAHRFNNAGMALDRFIEISKAFCTMYKDCDKQEGKR